MITYHLWIYNLLITRKKAASFLASVAPGRKQPNLLIQDSALLKLDKCGLTFSESHLLISYEALQEMLHFLLQWGWQ